MRYFDTRNQRVRVFTEPSVRTKIKNSTKSFKKPENILFIYTKTKQRSKIQHKTQTNRWKNYSIFSFNFIKLNESPWQHPRTVTITLTKLSSTTSTSTNLSTSTETSPLMSPGMPTQVYHVVYHWVQFNKIF